MQLGIIRALLIVGADGKVEGCTLDNATNSETLPAPACRVLEDAVFETIRRYRVFGLLAWTEEKARWVRWAAAWPAP